MSAVPERIVEIGFRSRGERCAGWLHLPDGPGPHPCVVLLHSTAGVRQLRCYAERGRAFAETGVAALQFDCRGFGASEGAPRQLFDVRRQAEDLRSAIAFAREHAELDSTRLALWGGSASCALVLDAAARDDAFRAVVCLTPFVPGRATQRSAGTPILRLGAAAFADRLRMALRRAPHGVRVGGEKGPRSRRRCWSWQGSRTSSARGPAAELARRAPSGELTSFPCGHFELYDGASIDAEAAFLVAALTGADPHSGV